MACFLGMLLCPRVQLDYSFKAQDKVCWAIVWKVCLLVRLKYWVNDSSIVLFFKMELFVVLVIDDNWQVFKFTNQITNEDIKLEY